MPYGDRRHAPIAAKDIARVIVSLLGDPSPHLSKRYILTGPENLTLSEMATTIGKAINQHIDYVDLPAEQWREALLHQIGLPEFLAEHLYQVAIDHQEGIFDLQTDTVELLTGKPPQNLTEFALEHESLFVGKQAVALGL
ncbi:MAG: hypothetical protein JKY51_02975 [Opitutaceae bacterium]|nr:hypothetical protein [Opitutaceae bacterium]